MSHEEQQVVHASIKRSCDYASWILHEINVRSNHVHVVVRAEKKPERVMSSMKAWATRALRETGHARADQTIWSRHGSTIYLFTDREFAYARWYTAEAQDGARFELPG
ncbi:transposase [Planctomycetaceae bacterium AH-315-I19]|nr:transposase [Planctomycetaceae bacterium AH-315-I19]